MKVTSAEFVKSAFSREHLPADGRPEIAFLGRSNVGKSSLLNSLLQRKGLARTSNTPGRTQSINYFAVNGAFYFVDLPGYGYARVSKSMRADWGKMAEDYLSTRRELALFVQLVDARHSPTDLDRQLGDWLAHHRKESVVVATKSDKLSANQLVKNIREVRGVFPDSDVIAYSAETGRGREEVWKAIGDALQKYRAKG